MSSIALLAIVTRGYLKSADKILDPDYSNPYYPSYTMARSYSRSRKSTRRKADDQAALIMLVVLVALALAYKISLQQVAKLMLLIAIAAGVAAVLIIFLKPSWERLHWRFGQALDMSFIDTMDGLVFERYVVALLKQHGYSHVRLTPRYDLGVDVVAEKDGVRWGVQVKRHAKLVGLHAIQQAVAGLKTYKCDRAMVITNSIFTKTAQKSAADNECILIDRNQLIKLIQAVGPEPSMKVA